MTVPDQPVLRPHVQFMLGQEVIGPTREAEKILRAADPVANYVMSKC